MQSHGVGAPGVCTFMHRTHDKNRGEVSGAGVGEQELEGEARQQNGQDESNRQKPIGESPGPSKESYSSGRKLGGHRVQCLNFLSFLETLVLCKTRGNNREEGSTPGPESYPICLSLLVQCIPVQFKSYPLHGFKLWTLKIARKSITPPAEGGISSLALASRLIP